MLNTIESNFLDMLLGTEDVLPYCAASKVSPEIGCSIYRHNTSATLLGVLQDVYPVCQKLVGDKFFQAMGTAFIKQYPSKTVSLLHYGEEFPGFVADFEPAKSLPYLSDVSRYEWAWHECFYAEEDSELDFEELAKVRPSEQAGLVFHLSHSATLLASEYPIHRIWEVNQPEYHGESLVDLNSGGVNLIIWRSGFEQCADILTVKQWKLLERLQGNCAVEEMCKNDIMPNLAEMVSRGWVTRFTLKNR